MYTDRDTDSTGTGLRRERAYADLRQRLLLGEFPLNQRLGELRLAALIGVSRTPIREALTRLHAEGLVMRAPDGGYVPTIPDVAAIRHLYEVRIALELSSLRRPAQVGTVHDPVALEALREEWEQLRAETGDEPDIAFVELDENFHISLSEACGNPAFADALQLVNDRIRVVRMQDFLSQGRVRVTIDEHLALLDAVIAGDLLEAERRFLAHLDASLAVVEERVRAVIDRMTTGPQP